MVYKPRERSLATMLICYDGQLPTVSLGKDRADSVDDDMVYSGDEERRDGDEVR